MATPLVDPSSARAAMDEHQIQSMQRLAESSRGSLSPAAAKAKEKKLREACEGFEAVFVQKMWEGMRASLPKEGPMHSRDEQFWQGMYDQELGKSIASSGGIGLADMMMSQLSRNLQNASEVAANANSRTPMVIPPVPLIPAASQKADVKVAAAPQTVTNGAPVQNDMYSGDATQPEAPSETQELAQTAAQITSTQTPAQAVANPTPPEILAALNGLAAQINATPAQAGTTHPLIAQALQQAAQQVQQALQTTQQGQAPQQVVTRGTTLPPVAGQGSLPVAQGSTQVTNNSVPVATQAVPGAAQNVTSVAAQNMPPATGQNVPVANAQMVGSRSQQANTQSAQQPRITRTTYITNDPQRITRQNRGAQRVTTGSPITGRSAPQNRQPAVQPYGTQQVSSQNTTQNPGQIPGQIPGSAGQNAGINTGSEVASPQTVTQGAGSPQAMRFTTPQQPNVTNTPNSLTAMTTTDNIR